MAEAIPPIMAKASIGIRVIELEAGPGEVDDGQGRIRL